MSSNLSSQNINDLMWKKNCLLGISESLCSYTYSKRTFLKVGLFYRILINNSQLINDKLTDNIISYNPNLSVKTINI